MDSPDKPPDWSGSIWVGAIDIGLDRSAGVSLKSAAGYTRARLLVRRGRAPLGFVEADVVDGAVASGELEQAIAMLPPTPAVADHAMVPPISVVLCTRDRPQLLRSAIASLLALDYPDFEIVIVDNASKTDLSARVVEEFKDSRVRWVAEPRPGLARARNRGVLEATKPIIAFTDDDVVVDPQWLRGFADGFDAGSDVDCVCGIVPSGELRSYSQAYFDSRVTWARSCRPVVYRLAEPPVGQPLFPFQVGQYGTGANFAMRRAAILALGGFDEALGVGSPTRGGEDIDIFVRVLLSDRALSYQPTAMVWHRHRAESSALHEQIVGYGVGLGAWITKLCIDRRTAPMVVRRAARGLLHARKMTTVDVRADRSEDEPRPGNLAMTELVALARGPLTLLKARRAGARRTPLGGGMHGESQLNRVTSVGRRTAGR